MLVTTNFILFRIIFLFSLVFWCGWRRRRPTRTSHHIGFTRAKSFTCLFLLFPFVGYLFTRMHHTDTHARRTQPASQPASRYLFLMRPPFACDVCVYVCTRAHTAHRTCYTCTFDDELRNTRKLMNEAIIWWGNKIRYRSSAEHKNFTPKNKVKLSSYCAKAWKHAASELSSRFRGSHNNVCVHAAPQTERFSQSWQPVPLYILYSIQFYRSTTGLHSICLHSCACASAFEFYDAETWLRLETQTQSLFVSYYNLPPSLSNKAFSLVHSRI